jgi:hypothetical protein
MSSFRPRPRAIRDVWIAVHGDDPAVGALTGEDQHRILCPYHFERTASCDVSFAKNTFFCRSCEAKGGVLDVVVLAGEANTRSEAIDWLKARGVNPC